MSVVEGSVTPALGRERRGPPNLAGQLFLVNVNFGFSERLCLRNKVKELDVGLRVEAPAAKSGGLNLIFGTT